MSKLDELYASIDALHFEGGWHRKQPSLWPEPRRNFHPYVWRYADVRPILERAGTLVDHQLAERRNLTMTNPVEGNRYATVRTMVAAYQSIRPGECAKAHRHTPNALRIILDGHGAYTVVGGTRVEMRPGDVLLTPSWQWHSHEAVGPDECFWVDVLDVPLVHLLEPMFFERHPDGVEADPINVEACAVAYRWKDTERALDRAPRCNNGLADYEVELGAPALRTMTIHVQRLQAGFTSLLHRSTANAIFTVIDGEGTTRVGNMDLAWRRGDVFVVPSWQQYQHRVSADAHLVRVSDAPVMRAFDLLRSEARAAPSGT